VIRLGIFDSGIGGLTVYREVRQALPGADIHYFGDTARVPYGTKSADTVTRYALQICSYLHARGVDAVVAACNTASAYAIEVLKSVLPIPVFGVVTPGAAAAVSSTSNGVIGVIGTRGTVSSGAYQRAITELDPEIKVVAAQCPLFVPLVEEGWLLDPITRGGCSTPSPRRLPSATLNLSWTRESIRWFSGVHTIPCSRRLSPWSWGMKSPL
jgi:glutamate racemase